MGGALHRMRTTSAALVVWGGGSAGLSLATYYTLSSVFENAKPSGPAVGSLTRIAVALLVVVAAGLIAAAAARVLWYVLPGEPVRRRGFQPERVGEAEPSVRLLTMLTTAGAVLSVLVGLPRVGRFTFTQFVFEYARPDLPIDWFGLLLCLVAGGAGVALAALAFAPARRAVSAPLIARAEPVVHLVTRDFDLERYAHRLGAPFLAAGEFVSHFDENVTEALADLAAQGSAQGAALLSRLRSAKTSLYVMAGGLTVAGVLALLSILAATGHFWIHSL
jgi:NADH:ubiquinone oxidoreductase subunit 5 (subunit L)/multisubunit Na+/H+ antiporter MnhA subunit